MARSPPLRVGSNGKYFNYRRPMYSQREAKFRSGRVLFLTLSSTENHAFGSG